MADLIQFTYRVYFSDDFSRSQTRGGLRFFWIKKANIERL